MKQLNQSNRRLDLVNNNQNYSQNGQNNQNQYQQQFQSNQSNRRQTGKGDQELSNTGSNYYDGPQEPQIKTAVNFNTNDLQQNSLHKKNVSSSNGPSQVLSQGDLQQFQQQFVKQQSSAAIQNQANGQKIVKSPKHIQTKSISNIHSIGNGTFSPTNTVSARKPQGDKSQVQIINQTNQSQRYLQNEYNNTVSPTAARRMKGPIYFNESSNINIKVSTDISAGGRKELLYQSQVGNLQQTIDPQNSNFHGVLNFENQGVGMITKRQSQINNGNQSQALNTIDDAYNAETMRNSQGHWNSQIPPNGMTAQIGASPTASLLANGVLGNQQQDKQGAIRDLQMKMIISDTNKRQLQNMRKSRYNNNQYAPAQTVVNHPITNIGALSPQSMTINVDGSIDSKTYRGAPAIKNNLLLSPQVQIASQGSNFPNSPKNIGSLQVQNKFQKQIVSSYGPREISNQGSSIANNRNQVQSGFDPQNVNKGHQGTRGFQQPINNNGRVQSLDASQPNQNAQKQRGMPSIQNSNQTNQIQISLSAAPNIPQQYQLNSTKNATNQQLILRQPNLQQIKSGKEQQASSSQQNQSGQFLSKTFRAPGQEGSGESMIQINQDQNKNENTVNAQVSQGELTKDIKKVQINTLSKPEILGSTVTSPLSNNNFSGATNLASQRTAVAPASKQSKHIESKLSALRHEQDSTAASNNQKLVQRFPMSSDEAFKLCSPFLWEIEKREIFEYKTIYFFCIDERKRSKGQPIQQGGLSEMGVTNEATNHGFDTECNEYLSRINEHLAYRYEVIKKLGKGSFGVVLKCFDHKLKEYVALKILKNKKRLYKQGLVEAKLVKHLNDLDPEDKKNIIRRLDQFVFRRHLIITFEMLSVNLYEFIKMNHFQGFSLNLIKRFAIQILISLYYLTENNIVHCDLKPENILLRKINKSGIKIIDFGSGCFENEKIYTYIQSRFYRAPEIVLGIPYTAAIDMWSFGCILYELYVGYPLFPGEDEKDHMALMMEVKGIPPRSVLARSTRRKVFYDDDYNPIIVPNSRGKIRMPGTKTLANLMNCSDKDFVDFIDKCTEWKPEVRLTPEQAFSHQFIAKAVNELKCLKDQPQQQEDSRQQTQSSGQTNGGNSDQQASQRSNQTQKLSKSGSKLPTIRKN